MFPIDSSDYRKKKCSFVALTKEPVISKGQFTLLAALMLGDLITNFGSLLESVVNSSCPKEIRHGAQSSSRHADSASPHFSPSPVRKGVDGREVCPWHLVELLLFQMGMCCFNGAEVFHLATRKEHENRLAFRCVGDAFNRKHREHFHTESSDVRASFAFKTKKRMRPNFTRQKPKGRPNKHTLESEKKRNGGKRPQVAGHHSLNRE